ncbi:oligosaccharide repeat unit polymerase, partial [Caldalkalibacillus mannanilyticus]|uniref:oligosaccharide repeat unit polymerase n=1 Tax=Caldalkalibacillus mannanilyticus TaxID=1418 RepID=UPI0005500352
MYSNEIQERKLNSIKATKNLYASIFIAMMLSVILIVFFILYMDSISINITLLILAFSILYIPLFFIKDLLHPFFLYSLIQSLILLHFTFKIVDGEGIRYAPLLLGEEKNFFLQYSISLFIVWHLCFYLGYYFSTKVKSNFIRRKNALEVNNPATIGFVLFGVGVLGFVFTIYLNGGLSATIAAMVNRVETYQGLGYLIKIVGLCGIGSIFLLFAGYKKTSFCFIVLSFLMLALFGGRGNALFGIFLPYIIVYHYLYKNIRLFKLGLFLIFGLLFTFIWGLLRSTGELVVSNDGFSETLKEVARQTGVADTIPSLVSKLYYGQLEFLGGQPLINIFFAPIPRGLWENKPRIDETGIVGQSIMGQDSWGLPPGPYGWAYFNFSWIGLIIIAFITGIIIYQVYKKYILLRKKR